MVTCLHVPTHTVINRYFFTLSLSPPSSSYHGSSTTLETQQPCITLSLTPCLLSLSPAPLLSKLSLFSSRVPAVLSHDALCCHIDVVNAKRLITTPRRSVLHTTAGRTILMPLSVCRLVLQLSMNFNAASPHRLCL